VFHEAMTFAVSEKRKEGPRLHSKPYLAVEWEHGKGGGGWLKKVGRSPTSGSWRWHDRTDGLQKISRIGARNKVQELGNNP